VELTLTVSVRLGIGSAEEAGAAGEAAGASAGLTVAVAGGASLGGGIRTEDCSDAGDREGSSLGSCCAGAVTAAACGARRLCADEVGEAEDDEETTDEAVRAEGVSGWRCTTAGTRDPLAGGRCSRDQVSISLRTAALAGD